MTTKAEKRKIVSALFDKLTPELDEILFRNIIDEISDEILTIKYRDADTRAVKSNLKKTISNIEYRYSEKQESDF